MSNSQVYPRCVDGNLTVPSVYHQLPGASYSESNLASIDFGGAPIYQYSPQSSSVHSEPNMLDFDMGLFSATHNPDTFDFTVRPPSPVNHFPLLAGQNSIQESHVMYFFEHVRKTNFRLAGNTLTNVTYSVGRNPASLKSCLMKRHQLIVQDPRGVVTNAVCALASLHFTRMRVSQGLEAPDLNPEHSTAQYFYEEAFFQLASGKQTRGCHDESDVLAAIYLIFYSQMAGKAIDWQPLLTIALDWMAQTGLTTDENPKLTLLNMSAPRQLVVKLTVVSTGSSCQVRWLTPTPVDRDLRVIYRDTPTEIHDVVQAFVGRLAFAVGTDAER